MSKIFKTGGRYGFRSGGGKMKHAEVVGDYKGRTNMAMGCGLVVASSSFPWDTTSNTEQSAALCKVYDATNVEFQNFATSGTGAGFTANYQTFPDTEAIGDAIYFGYASKFGAMFMDMSATVGVYSADACTWEYWNGSAWMPFTPYDETDTTANDGKRPFQGDGYIIMAVGTDWQPSTVDTQSAYWVRARVTTAATITTQGLSNSVEHAVTTLTNGGSVVNTFGTISRGMFRFETVSGATADTIVILCNMTTGQSSGVKTLTKAVADNDVSDFNLVVNRGDSLAFFCTQEDGTTEFAGGMCELAIDHS